MNRSSYAALVVRGGTTAPDAISREMGLEPTWFADVGSPSPTSIIKRLSEGQVEGPIAKSNAWTYRTPANQSLPEQSLEQLKDILTGKETLLANLASEADVRFQVVVNYQIDRSEDEDFVHDVVVLNPSLLSWISEIGAVLEVYFSE